MENSSPTQTQRGELVPQPYAFEPPPKPPIMAPSNATSPPIGGESTLSFKLSQCFGDCSPAEEVTEADILSAVEFDSTGEYLATGDKGGRVVIFKQNSARKQKVSASGKVRQASDYKFFTEFQSHEQEFDYLKSLEIEEKINQIKWCSKTHNSLMLLSTNDKTVKLWKVQEKKVAKVSTMGMHAYSNMPKASRRLRMPVVDVEGTTVTAQPRRIFSNAHAYHVNSIDPNVDGEHFMSVDDLRMNLWNLEVTDKSFNIVDIKPKNMEELTEVITSACFHPTQCNVFMYSSSRGSIKIGDMRASALCDVQAKVLYEGTDSSSKSFFSEIVASISDIKCTSDGRYIVSRDYMTLKMWDVNMERRPLKTIHVHDQLRGQLCDLYENDCIFDKFECAVSGNATHVMSGTYGSACQLYDRFGNKQCTLEVSKDPSKRGKKSKRKGAAGGPAPHTPLDYEKKILHLSWHPQDDIIAVAGLNKLYIYTAQR
ncbi:unnamed protein product [Chrysoparadoxa australica]